MFPVYTGSKKISDIEKLGLLYKTSAATLTGERESSCIASPVGSSPPSAIEVWSLDIKAVEDVMLRLGSSVTPIFATEASSGLREL